jgi:hypothetical protein
MVLDVFVKIFLMKKKYLLFVCILPLLATSQSLVKLSPDLRWPKDTLEFQSLIKSLNSFVEATHRPNEENKFVRTDGKAESFVLLDEFQGIEDHPKLKAKNFYKPIFTNVIVRPDHQYLVQLTYLGLRDSLPNLRAQFDLVASKEGDGFVFASPLLISTKSWKKLSLGAITFHYKDTLDKLQANLYGNYCAQFDKKLKAENKSTEIYCCDDLQELEQILGVRYKSDYNGRSAGAWSARSGDRKVLLMGDHSASFSKFDPHDLWHERLGNVIPRSQTNRSVDEGCAYLYGGSWGFTWEEIFSEFKKQIASNAASDWKVIKETPVYFKTGEFQNSADYIVNALLVKKIEQEKGFAGVWEFLNCGKVEKGNEKYYQALEKLTGITAGNYNEKVWELIKQEH